MAIVHPLCVALCLLCAVHYSDSLACYRCAGMMATLDGVENGDTAAIITAIDSVSSAFFSLPLNEDCMSTDTADLQAFEDAETCQTDEVCIYLNMTLTNDNYDNKGELVLSGVIRQCQVNSGDSDCFTGSGSGLTADADATLLFGTLSDVYGTTDLVNEPQEVFGCHCSDSDNCNVEYDAIDDSGTTDGDDSDDTSESTTTESTTTQSATTGDATTLPSAGTLLKCVVPLMVALLM